MKPEDHLRRTFASDAPEPGPTDEVWSRIVQQADSQRGRRWRHIVLAGVAALGLGGVGVGLSGALAPGGRPTRVAVVPAPGSAWRSEGSMVWHHGGPPNYLAYGPPTMLSCTGRSKPVCYLVVQALQIKSVGNRSNSSVEYLPLESSTLFRSGTDGATWARVALPDDTWLTSPLDCAAADRCEVAAVLDASPSSTPGESGRAVLLSTTDAGRRWSVRRLPATTGMVPALSCPTEQRCIALAWGTKGTEIGHLGPLSGASRFFTTAVLTTSNGGRSWSIGRLPARPASTYYQLSSLQCPSASVCYVLGERASITERDGGYVENEGAYQIMSSRDGGRVWTAVFERSGLQPSSLACPTSSSCVAVAQRVAPADGSPADGSPIVLTTTDAGRRWTSRTGRLPAALDEYGLPLSCPTRGYCIATAGSTTAVSEDGGSRWSVSNGLPGPGGSYSGDLSDLSCTAAAECFGVEDMVTPPTGGLFASRVLAERSTGPG